jgi:hypothetical protein
MLEGSKGSHVYATRRGLLCFAKRNGAKRKGGHAVNDTAQAWMLLKGEPCEWSSTLRSAIRGVSYALEFTHPWHGFTGEWYRLPEMHASSGSHRYTCLVLTKNPSAPTVAIRP